MKIPIKTLLKCHC